MTETQIAKLINKARKGDNAAFEKLIEQKKRNITYIALSVLRNENDAEDAVQEAILSMYRHIEDLNEGAAFNSWMYKTVYRSCLRVQDDKRKQSNGAMDAIEEHDFVEQRTELIPDANRESDELRDYFVHKLDQLSENYRACLYLFYFGDMTYSQIAEVLGVTKKDVANWLDRGRRKLREELNKENITDSNKALFAFEASVLNAAFAFDMERTLKGNKEQMVERALDSIVVLGVSGSIIGGVSLFGSIVSLKSFIIGIVSLLAVSGVVAGAFFFGGDLVGLPFSQEQKQTTHSMKIESQESGASGDLPQSEDSDNDGDSFSRDSSIPESSREGGATTGGSTIEEGNEEGSTSFIIENEVFYEIMNEDDEDKVSSGDDPGNTSNKVSTVIEDHVESSSSSKTSDPLLGVIGVLALVAMIAGGLLLFLKFSTQNRGSRRKRKSEE